MSPLTPRQRQVLEALSASDPALVLRVDELRGIVALARGTLLGPDAEARDPEAVVERFLGRAGEMFGPPDTAGWLRLLQRSTDATGWTHLEYQQEHRRGKSAPPLEVYGAKLVAHVRPDGALAEIQSSCWHDVEVPARARVSASALRTRLLKRAAASPDFPALSAMMRKRRERNFPLMQPARLVAFFWRDRFHLAWTSYAYMPSAESGPPARAPGPLHLELRQVFFDAMTGEEILTSPVTMHVNNPVVGSGMSVQGSRPTPVPRVLSVVQVGATTTHLLWDTTHSLSWDTTRSCHIITYDLAQDPRWTTVAQIGTGIVDGSLPVSTSTTGSDWGQTWPGVSRGESQQPEVDAHFLTARVYEWYDAVSGGRAGWDNGKYPTTTVPANLPVRVMTHVPPDLTVNAGMTKHLAGDVWYPFLWFWDCDPNLSCSGTAPDRAQDYWAGSPNIVAHEYQHAITAFSFMDGNGNPGIGYRFWAAALHEGLADAFAGLCSEIWSWGPEVSPAGMVIRNAAYPRDPLAWENAPGLYPCSLQRQNKDHFADQAMDMTLPPGEWADQAQAYNHGTILAHCAYLMGQGGVHQRLSRTPALIPVEGLGYESRGGLSVLRAARIWYQALVDRLAAYVGSQTGNVQADARIFYQVGDACVSAAAQHFGSGSVEHRTAALAVYAVGLRDPGTPYGADVTFLRWGWSWRDSRRYLGGIYANAPDWASLDLFINNGGGPSGWTAVIDPGTGATRPENQVYCRVRNVGDLDAAGVSVTFSYAKISAVAGPWTPVTDASGVAQTLAVGALGAGQMTFGDTQADQDPPPASAMIRWWIPPLAPGEVVDHFCLKAVVTATNDVNPHNNEVQSNIAYIPYAAGAPRPFRFWNEAIHGSGRPFETVVEVALPHRWRVSDLAPEPPPDGSEGYAVSLTIEVPEGARERMEAPFDGEVVGSLTGGLSGEVHGALTAVTGEPARLKGHIALALAELGTVLGSFTGRLDPHTGAVRGRVAGVFQNAATGRGDLVGVWLEGRLEPWRRINVSQRVEGQTLGGFTVQIYGGVPGTPAPATEPAAHRGKATSS